MTAIKIVGYALIGFVVATIASEAGISHWPRMGLAAGFGLGLALVIMGSQERTSR